MLFLYPNPYPFKNGSQGDNECSNSLTLDGTKINDLSYYQNLGTSIPLSRECLKEKEEKYQLISIYFAVESEDDKRFVY